MVIGIFHLQKFMSPYSLQLYTFISHSEKINSSTNIKQPDRKVYDEKKAVDDRMNQIIADYT